MHIKQVSLVALDLDGTLLDTNSEISPTNESILRYIDKLGVYVVIATSRRYEDAKRYQINLPLNTIWICTSGAEIRIIDGKVSLRDERLPKAFSEQVIATFDHLGVEYAICIDGIIYKKSSKYKILSDNIVEIPHIYPVLSVGNPSHFIIIGDTSINLVQSSELSTPLLDNSIQYYFPVDNRQPFPRMHLLPLRTNKADALLFVLQFLDVLPRHVIAMGDGDIDISMLEAAGISAVPSNAQDNVKKIAQIVSVSNSENFVAQVLGEYFPKFKGMYD